MGREIRQCPVCDDHHDIEKSQVFLSQTIKDRSKTLYKKSYYGCLGNISKEPNAKGCVKEGCAKFAVKDTP